MALAAIITARKDSRRIPGKNHLIIGKHPLWLRSALFAQINSLRAIVDSDDELILSKASEIGIETHRRKVPPESEGGTHWEAMRAAALDLGLAHYILLQPTSPFRSSKVLESCLSAHQDRHDLPVLTSPDGHGWDGNIGIFHVSHQWMPNPCLCQTVLNPFPYDIQIDEHSDIVVARRIERLLPGGGLA